MNIIDLINISSNNRKFISVLGFGEPTTSLDLLTGMLNGKVEPYSFDIQIEPNLTARLLMVLIKRYIKHIKRLKILK